MSRYIDADALIKELCSDCALFLDQTCDGNRISCYPSSIVREQPTVDAVQVVRCGECGHYHSEDDPAYCDELCTIHIEPTDGCLRGIKRGAEVGYCAADGKRNDNETELKGDNHEKELY